MAEENEKKDSSTIGKINNVVNKGKNLKRVYKTAKTARTLMMAAEGAELLANPAVVVILAIAFVLVVVIIILFGGVSGVNGGDLTNSPPPTGGNNSGSAVQPMPVNEIAKYFVITGATEAQKQIIYKMFSVSMGSAKYFSLLTSKGTIYINFIYRRGNVIDGGAFFGDGKTMQFTSFFESGISYDMKAHILIHESIHIIQQRQGNLGFNLQQLMSQDGNNCYDDGWIKTYAFRNSNYPNASDFAHKTRESMAEAGANNVFCKPGALCDFNKIYSSTAIDYQKACKNTYAWAQANIFGGDDFFTPQESSTQGNPTSTTNFPKTPKSNTNCDGTPAGKYGNFGNPNCDFSRDKLYQLLQQLDKGTTKTNTGKIRTNVDIWYNSLIPHESGYEPNAVALHSASGRGAYGLFQMNPNGYGSTYDSGNVEWHWQVTNAINKENSLSALCKWQYWGAVANGQVVDKVASCR